MMRDTSILPEKTGNFTVPLLISGLIESIFKLRSHLLKSNLFHKRYKPCFDTR